MKWENKIWHPDPSKGNLSKYCEKKHGDESWRKSIQHKKGPYLEFLFFFCRFLCMNKKLNLKNLSWMSQVPWIFTNKLGCVLKLVNVFYYSKLWDPIGIHHHEFHPPICFTTFPSTQKKHKSHPQTGHHRAKTEAQICICDGEDDKAKEAGWFSEIIFFSKTFFASSTLLLGLFFNGLAQFSMIFCQKLPYLGDFVASFCLTKGGNGSRGEHVLAPCRLALWCFCKAFFSGCTVMVSGFFVFPNLAAGFAIDVESIPNLSSSQERWQFCPVHDL